MRGSELGGSTTTDQPPAVELLQMYERMLSIRRFEETVADVYQQGDIPGFSHLYLGQEAVAVGVCSALRDDDFITSTHRGHGHVIAKGADLERMMAELFAKASGYCKGKGGSMHIADTALGILGANGIVGAGLPIAVGAAYSARLRGTDQVVAAFFGDGAITEGAFHESVNLAAAWSLPALFVFERNDFAVGTRFARVSKLDVDHLGAAYGLRSESVDGNDVSAVRTAAEADVALA
jgi:acetoin:2,6-dichlorophenolindophenol oxidoreductase subunit alpha